MAAGTLTKRQENAQRRVINAARKWRSVYVAWVNSDGETRAVRDMRANGENLALSKLLDALQDLDDANSEVGA